MGFEEIFQQWHAMPWNADTEKARQRLEHEARELLDKRQIPDIEWPLTVLTNVATKEQSESDYNRVRFLLWVWRKAGQVREPLFEPLLRAGVYEPDPSYNRSYIEPCLRTFGPWRTITRLIEYLETGSNYEKAGANNALYWARGLSKQYLSGDEFSNEVTRRQLPTRLRELRLREFISNPDVEVRRSLIPSLELKPEDYSPEFFPLLHEAVTIARSHSDDYIRHRVEIQLGSGGPFLPLPHRTS